MMTLRKCIHCGIERQTYSQRSQYVCGAERCHTMAKRVAVPRSRSNAREQAYYERLARISRRQKRAGLGCKIYGL